MFPSRAEHIPSSRCHPENHSSLWATSCRGSRPSDALAYAMAVRSFARQKDHVGSDWRWRAEVRPVQHAILNIKIHVFVLLIKPNSVRKVFKARVRTERIEARSQQHTGVKSLIVAFFEPIHGSICVPERCVDHRNL